MTEKILTEIACCFPIKDLEKWYHDLREATGKKDINGVIETLEIVRGCARYYALDFDVYPDNIRAIYACGDIYLYDYGISGNYMFVPVAANILRTQEKRLHDYLIHYKDCVMTLKSGAYTDDDVQAAGHMYSKLDGFLMRTNGAGIKTIRYVTEKRIEIQLDNGEFVDAYDSRKRD